MRLTELAHDLLRPHLFPGAFVVDGTAGQGHDTLFLARAVGPTGHVIAFDPQPAALSATQSRLTQAGIPSLIVERDLKNEVERMIEFNSTVFASASDKSLITHHTSHICLLGTGHENAPHLLLGYPPLQAVVLNLGYLPGADHSVTTTAPHTLVFLDWAAKHLSPGGVLSVLAYRAHPGGEEEAQAVASFAQKLAAESWSHHTHQGPPGRLPSPILHFLTKPLASD